jgi:predicted 3-demethylubiquinone-9 3-methyltransferase (glyoxalase superfamily)
MPKSAKVRTCLFFEKGGHAAATFYVSLLPDSRIDSVQAMGNPADPMVVEFTLAGAPMMILTAGPMFQLTPAVSISVSTKDQAETDRLWSALLADGGAESQCGWLTDRFGVSWQIVPERLMQMHASPDAAAAGRAMAAMLTMKKIDVAALEAAFAR